MWLFPSVDRVTGVNMDLRSKTRVHALRVWLKNKVIWCPECRRQLAPEEYQLIPEFGNRWTPKCFRCLTVVVVNPDPVTLLGTLSDEEGA